MADGTVSDTAAMIAFYAARLDESEAVANGLLFACLIPGKLPDFSSCGGPAAEAYWQHFTATRMLRRVEAGRAILDLADKAREWVEVSAGATAGYAKLIITDTLRYLIAEFSDHPDYRQDWKP